MTESFVVAIGKPTSQSCSMLADQSLHIISYELQSLFICSIFFFCSAPQDKGLDTQGEFSQWWQSNLDPKAKAASVKGMKVRYNLAW